MVKSVAAGGEQPSGPLADALGNLLDQDVSATDQVLPVVRTARAQPTGTTRLETPAEPVGPPAGSAGSPASGRSRQ